MFAACSIHKKHKDHDSTWYEGMAIKSHEAMEAEGARRRCAPTKVDAFYNEI
jgi:hypothetical protein